MIISNAKHIPLVGDFVHPDEWKMGENLLADDGFKDSSFPGCEFRLPGGLDYKLAVNIRVTGKPHFLYELGGQSWCKSRCKIEFVGDGEPSEFTGGWIFHKGV